MTNNSFSDASTAFAIVSPCSQCKNQRSEMSVDGKPLCPRRKWQADQKEYMTQHNGNADERLAPLVTFGTEGTPQEGDNSLRNPVYLDDGKTTLVWIATLRDNAGMRDENDEVIAKSILDPEFIPDQTDYIHCRSKPFIPLQHESAYRQSGSLTEGDVVMAITVTEQQFSTVSGISDDNPNEYQSLLIDGVVSKVNLVYRTPRSPVAVDFTVEGT